MGDGRGCYHDRVQGRVVEEMVELVRRLRVRALDLQLLAGFRVDVANPAKLRLGNACEAPCEIGAPMGESDHSDGNAPTGEAPWR